MDVQAGGYAGSESYKYVEPILEDSSKELLVISPYISMGYAKTLVELGKRKKVRVITSQSSQSVANYINHRSKYLLYGYVKAMIIFIIATFVSIYFSLYLISLGAFALAALLALIALVRYKISKNSNIEIKISYDKFVHEKVYISQSAAAIGSANLTYSGMKKNIERVEVITEPSRIKTLKDHFFELWKACK